MQGWLSSREELRNLDLTGLNPNLTDWTGAKLHGAILPDANLQDVKLAGANMFEADLSHVIGLTRPQLEEALNVDSSRLPAYLLSMPATPVAGPSAAK